jgi:hypothetical protein
MDLPECLICRQIAILRRNPKRSSNRLTTKKKTQTLSLLFETVLFALDETNFRQICSNFFSSKLQKNQKKKQKETTNMDYLSVGFFDRSQFCNVMHGSAVVARQNKPASAGRAALRTPEKLLLSSA